MRRIQSHSQRRRQGLGFTVLEMMVVIFLAVILFALAGGGLIRTMRISRDEINRTSRVMTARLVMERLARDIESAFPYRSPETGEIVFTGADAALEYGPADQLTLVRPRLGAPVPKELERVTYYVRLRETDRGTQQVVISSRDPVGRPTAVREVVLGLVEPSSNVALDLQYLTSGPEGEVWSPAWEDGQRLPDAVKVHLEVTDRRMPGVIEFETIVPIHSELIGGGTE